MKLFQYISSNMQRLAHTSVEMVTGLSIAYIFCFFNYHIDLLKINGYALENGDGLWIGNCIYRPLVTHNCGCKI